MARHASVRRARRQKGREMAGFVVTWDVDSRDRTQCARLRRFMFGDTVTSKGRRYVYPGFVQRDGVRYLGQSVVFVTRELLAILSGFLRSNGVEFVVTEARLGGVSGSDRRTGDGQGVRTN